MYVTVRNGKTWVYRTCNWQFQLPNSLARDESPGENKLPTPTFTASKHKRHQLSSVGNAISIARRRHDFLGSATECQKTWKPKLQARLAMLSIGLNKSAIRVRYLSDDNDKWYCYQYLHFKFILETINYFPDRDNQSSRCKCSHASLNMSWC